MRKTLTKRTITAAIATGMPEGQAYVMLWDTSPPGFGLRIRKSGGASWLLTYRPRGSARGTPARTLTLGTWPAMAIETARGLALAQVGKIASGHDPASELRQARLRSRSTVGAALDDYERSLKQRHVVQWKMAMSALRRGFKSDLAAEISDLDLRKLAGLIDRISTTPRKRVDGTVYTTPGAGDEFRKHAHAFLGWAALRGLIKLNPLGGYRTATKSREERRLGKLRQGRALDDREIAALWAAAGDFGAFGNLVRLGLLSGLRRDELSELRWSDIDGGVIVVSGDRTKSGREHRVPLTELMREVLDAQRSSNKWIFPSSRTGSPMVGWSKLMPRLIEASGVSFRLHDLRRTCRTLMSKLGVDEATAEAAIGHSGKSALVAIYDHHDRWELRVSAFEKVSDHVAGLLAGTPETAKREAPASRPRLRVV